MNIKDIVAKNIKKQNTREFEKMIIQVSGENLAEIEFLGGIVGILTGIGLKNPFFLFYLPLAMLLFFGNRENFDEN